MNDVVRNVMRCAACHREASFLYGATFAQCQECYRMHVGEGAWRCLEPARVPPTDMRQRAEDAEARVAALEHVVRTGGALYRAERVRLGCGLGGHDVDQTAALHVGRLEGELRALDARVTGLEAGPSLQATKPKPCDHGGGGPGFCQECLQYVNEKGRPNPIEDVLAMVRAQIKVLVDCKRLTEQAPEAPDSSQRRLEMNGGLEELRNLRDAIEKYWPTK